MSTSKENLSRRGFLKTIGTAGVGSLLAGSQLFADEKKPTAKGPTTKPTRKSPIPLRDFGKTGVKVPILALGGIFDTGKGHLVLKQAVKWGVTYWDTAEGYLRGRSEKGMGEYFAANSKDRKKIFLVTKSTQRNPTKLTERLNSSLERLQTDYVDLFFLHQVSEGSMLTDEIKQWAQKMKKAKKIRFFGFSTHRNMPQSLSAAAKAGWIDGLMTTYNFRIIEQMKRPIEECAKAGVGVTAMKVIGRKSRGRKGSSPSESKVLESFIAKGFTPEQGALKVVWDNPHVASICTLMPNLTILMADVAAALDKTKLMEKDKKLLALQAQETCSGYCAGCASICESAVPGNVPVPDVMRYLMYYHEYGDRDRARELFREIPRRTRNELALADYSLAERRCPNHMPIADLMKEASRILA